MRKTQSKTRHFRKAKGKQTGDITGQCVATRSHWALDTSEAPMEQNYGNNYVGDPSLYRLLPPQISLNCHANDNLILNIFYMSINYFL